MTAHEARILSGTTQQQLILNKIYALVRQSAEKQARRCTLRGSYREPYQRNPLIEAGKQLVKDGYKIVECLVDPTSRECKFILTIEW